MIRRFDILATAVLFLGGCERNPGSMEEASAGTPTPGLR